MQKIAVIDYGMGNLRSVAKALEECGATPLVTDKREDIYRSSKVVFPGVGSFGKCIERLRALELLECIKEQVFEKPFLGICLGLQALFSYGTEGGIIEGLDSISGKVVRFTGGVKIPHMGWNQVQLIKDCPLFKGIPPSSYFYFVHSYYVIPDDESVVCGKTTYAVDFTSAIWKDTLFAVQFHPEKSQQVGLKVLENFVKL
ncbi:imidazole glycerol phosphate synthase subunit HisH [Chlamydiota bacterium]